MIKYTATAVERNTAPNLPARTAVGILVLGRQVEG